jgi:hypothetical protein
VKFFVFFFFLSVYLCKQRAAVHICEHLKKPSLPRERDEDPTTLQNKNYKKSCYFLFCFAFGNICNGDSVAEATTKVPNKAHGALIIFKKKKKKKKKNHLHCKTCI